MKLKLILDYKSYISINDGTEKWGESFFNNIIKQESVIHFFSLIPRKGYLIARISGEDLELIIIGVDKANRREGLAKEMLIKLFSFAEKKKLKKIFLEVAVNNRSAINLYKKAGFKTYKKRENYYKKNRKKETALLMLKDITF